MRPDRHALMAAGSAALLALLAVGAVGPATAAGDEVVVMSEPGESGTERPSESSTQPPSESPSESPSVSESGSSSESPTSGASPTGPAETETTAPDDDAVRLDDAVLRWGLNDESSNRAFAPRTYNFFSAGRTPDPGKGGTSLPKRQWRQAKGDVAIQKWVGSRWRAATWAGLRTDSAGKPLGAPTAGTFSNHRFVFSGGTGEVDRDAGTAHIEWDGDVTVLYYSGMATYYLSDPVLDVADGTGTLTATLQGYASSVDDPSTWKPIRAVEVTVADLPEVELDAKRGFTATPAYLDVKVSGVAQRLDVPHAGSFPQSFVDYMDRLGIAAFWLSSGGITDAFKVAQPLTIGYDAAAAPVDPTPTSQPTKPPVDNPIVTPPATVTIPAAPIAQPPALPAAPPAVAAPPVAAVPAADVLPVPTQLVRLAPTAAEPGVSGDSHGSAVWWLGGGLLLLAALTLLVPTPPRKENP